MALARRKASPSRSEVPADDAAAENCFYGRVFALACDAASSLLKDRAAAEEVGQDVVAHLWEKWRGVPTGPSAPDPLEPFVARCTRRRVVDYVRREDRDRERTVDLELIDLEGRATSDAPESAAIARDLAHRFGRALDDMTPERRDTYFRFMDDGLTCAEIARERGRSTSTVYNHIANALDALRKAWRAYEAHEEDAT
jgi:RNA polymerase sigma factor (sigma-70 family)